jgi:outer membrane receptor protein involved in Fe transport
VLKLLGRLSGSIALAVVLGMGSGIARSEGLTHALSAQGLADALDSFSKDTGLQLVYRAQIASGLKTNGAQAGRPAEETLREILEGTGLDFEFINSKTVAILQPKEFPIASRSADAAFDDAPTNDVSLEEIVVTAQKRIEHLQDVPVPVTALNAQSLVNSNQLRIQDYYTQVPGLSLTTDGLGSPNLTVRGISTGSGTNPTVGIVVDDLPYGASTINGGGNVVPDIDPNDLARIEVLRGPQGTLYGASSIGGLMKYVTIDPSTDAWSARLQGGVLHVRNGDEAGYNVRGAVNVPVGDTFAIRATGFTRKDPGYIDDPVLNEDGVNSGEASGGRLSALWRMSEAFSLKLSALLQETEADGSPAIYSLPTLSDLEQTALKGSGGHHRKTQSYAATLSGKLGSADLVAISGYNVNRNATVFDLTPLFGLLTECGFLPDCIPGTGFDGFGVRGSPNFETYRTAKFSEEVRLSVPLARKLDALFGAYYTRERSRYIADFLAVDPATGALGPSSGSWLHTASPHLYEEYAAFADLTFHVTDRFDIQVGGRESRNKQEFSSVQTGPYASLFLGVSPRITPEADSKDNVFTYLITPRFQVSPDLMAYARLASGYRPGGPNPNVASTLPQSYGPDETRNYEVGVKGDLPGRHLSFDASVYYIDWQDLQLQLVDPLSLASYYTNASRAKSQGVELSVESMPLPGLRVAGWVAWNDAELTEDIPDGGPGTPVGVSGDRLPFSGKFSGSLSLDQEFPLMGMTTGFIGATVSYVDDRESIFTPTPQRQIFRSYAKTDLRAGLRYETWTAQLFVTNLADKRAALWGGVGTFPEYSFLYVQPRTVGLTLSKTFGR